MSKTYYAPFNKWAEIETFTLTAEILISDHTRITAHRDTTYGFTQLPGSKLTQCFARSFWASADEDLH